MEASADKKITQKEAEENIKHKRLFTEVQKM
jgi:hypothetical protein